MVRISGVVFAAALSLTALSQSLNPLVVRTPEPRGPVPAECEEGRSPVPAPRIDLRQVPLPEPEEVPPPPSGTLRSALQVAQDALARNDRAAFDAALARARELAADYPAGAERRTAEELLTIYTNAERLWDAQFTSPFFGEDSAEYQALRAYPGYADAVRRSTLTDDDGRRFYPAAESRAFLAGVAASRLQSSGMKSTAPPPTEREVRRRPSVPRTETRVEPRTRSAAPSTTTRRTTAPATKRAPATRTAETTPSKPAPRPAAPAAAVPKPVIAAPPASAATAPALDDLATATRTPIVTPPDTPTTTFVTETAPVTPDTTPITEPLTDTAVVDTPAPAGEAPAPSRTRSILLPTILILIGLGVLVLLFRMSD